MPEYALTITLMILSSLYPNNPGASETQILEHHEFRRDMTLIDCAKLMEGRDRYDWETKNSPYSELFRDPGGLKDPVRKVIVTFSCEKQEERSRFKVTPNDDGVLKWDNNTGVTPLTDKIWCPTNDPLLDCRKR